MSMRFADTKIGGDRTILPLRKGQDRTWPLPRLGKLAGRAARPPQAATWKTALHHGDRQTPRGRLTARLFKSQCTCSSGYSRVLSVPVGHRFKCDRPLVALAVVSNHRYHSKKAHLFHADIQRVEPPLLRLAIRSRYRRGASDRMMQNWDGIESLTAHANSP